MARNKKPKNKKKTSTKKITTTTTTTVVTTTTELNKSLDTHYLLVLDRSGSMSNCWQSTIDGLNEQLALIRGLEEKYPEQRYFVSLVVFDSEIETILEDAPITEVKNFDGTEFPPRYTTALHDAMGMGISNLKATITNKNKENDSISTAIVVIMTDGGENASREHNSDSIKKTIEGLEKTGAWTFSFMGANQDAILAAKNFGIGAGNSITYTSSSKGAKTAFDTLNRAFAAKAGMSNMAYTNSVASTGTVSLNSLQMDNSNFLSEVVDGDTLGEDDSNIKNKNKA